MGCHPRFCLLVSLEGNVLGLQVPVGGMDLSLPLAEFYTRGLAVAWLSLAASVALVVAGAPVVELVDAVAVVVRVAMVSPLRQFGLGLFPTASVLPRVSKVVYRLPRGLCYPVLGLALAQECRLVVGFALQTVGLHPGSPSAESRLARPAAGSGLDHASVESFCLSSPSWAYLVWGLSWVLGSSPALPSWVSSRVAAPWIHLLPHQVRVLGAF